MEEKKVNVFKELCRMKCRRDFNNNFVISKLVRIIEVNYNVFWIVNN